MKKETDGVSVWDTLNRLRENLNSTPSPRGTLYYRTRHQFYNYIYKNIHQNCFILWEENQCQLEFFFCMKLSKISVNFLQWWYLSHCHNHPLSPEPHFHSNLHYLAIYTRLGRWLRSSIDLQTWRILWFI